MMYSRVVNLMLALTVTMFATCLAKTSTVTFPYSYSLTEYANNFVPNFLSVFKQSLRLVDYDDNVVLGQVILSTIDEPHKSIGNAEKVLHTLNTDGYHLAKYLKSVGEDFSTDPVIRDIYLRAMSIDDKIKTYAEKQCGGDIKCIKSIFGTIGQKFVMALSTDKQIVSYFSEIAFGVSQFDLDVMSVTTAIEIYVLGVLKVDITSLIDELYEQYLDEPTFDNFNSNLLPYFLRKIITVLENSDVMEVLSDVVNKIRNKKIIKIVHRSLDILDSEVDQVFFY